MSFGGEKSISQPDPFEVLDRDFPIKYTVPFQWGQFKITENAYEHYGLTPLVEGFISSDAPLDTESHARSVIRVIGPSEVPNLTNPTEATHIQAIRGETVRIDIGYKDASSFIGYLVDRHLEREGIDLDDFEADAQRQEFEDHRTQLILHFICDSVGENIAEPYVELMQRERTKIASGSAAILIAGVSAVSSLVAYDMLKASKFSKVADSATFLGALGAGVYGVKRIIEQLGGSEEMHEVLDLSGGVAEMVATDIHDAFCTDRFDEKFTEIIEEGQE